MAVMGWNSDQLGAMVRHTGPLDAKEFLLRAERLAAYGPQMAEGFPKGSGGSDKVAVNDAAPEIWTDAAGFQAKIDSYTAESKKLVDAAKSGDEITVLVTIPVSQVTWIPGGWVPNLQAGTTGYINSSTLSGQFTLRRE